MKVIYSTCFVYVFLTSLLVLSPSSLDQISNYASFAKQCHEPPEHILFTSACTNLTNPFSPLEVCTCDYDVREQLFHNFFSYSEINLLLYGITSK